MKRSTALVGVLVAAFALPASAAAGPRFAAPGGSTTDPNCDAAHPCEIHRALETVAQNNEDVTIKPGNYSVSTPIAVTAQNLVIHGTAGSPRPVISISAA